jgi:hypothetical protein
MLYACGDPAAPKEDERPATIAFGPDTTVLKSGATAQLAPTVKTKAEVTLTEVKDLTFTTSDSVVASVDATGLVTGGRAGKATITATVGALKATAFVTVTAGAPATVVKANEPPSNPAVGASTPFSVRVSDAKGNLVGDAIVTFAVTKGNGSVTASDTTNASGVASGSFKLDTIAGGNTATASVEGVTTPVTFTVTTIAGPAAILTEVTSDPAGVVAGSAAGEIKARVTDKYGNPKSGTTVIFAGAGGGATVSPTNAISDGTGEAKTTFTTGKTVGLNTVRATVQGVADTARFTTTTIPGPSTKVAVSVPVVSVAVGGTATVTATTADANNNPTNGALTYVSRSDIATVSTAGQVEGVAPGQTFVVASGELGVDSMMVVVRGPDTPVLMADITAFNAAANTDVVLTVVMDMTGTTSKLGSTTVKLEWDPTVVSFRSTAAITGVGATVNSGTSSSGSLSFTVANAAGLSGRVQLVKITLHTTTAVGKSGTLRLIASELTAAGTFTNLLPKLMLATIPIVTR